jgi:hypothetical protein
MYRNALLRGFIGVGASIGLALPCFSQGISEMGAVYAMPKPNPANSGITGSVGRLYGAGALNTGGAVNSGADLPSSAATPGLELTSVQIKQMKASKKQADILYKNGLAAEAKGDLKTAQACYYRTLMLRQKLYGKGDWGIYILTSRLGEIGLKQKDWEYADKCFKELMKAQNKAHGPGDYDTVPILLKLAQVEEGRKELPAQIDYLERALALQERKKGPNAPECLATRLSLLSATINDGDWRDGDERLKKAMDIENGKGNTKTREYLQLLKDGSKIMTGLNKPTEAADYDRQAAELEAQLPPPPPPKTKATPAKSTAPAATAPATKPNGAKPAATKPEATKPAETKPEATKPVATTPAPTTPAVTTPPPTTPAVTKPATTAPSGKTKASPETAPTSEKSSDLAPSPDSKTK